MAKLQKDKRSPGPHHHARHSTGTQPRAKAVRLTPAEIRAYSNGELARSQSQIVPRQSSTQLSEGHATPPPSPSREQSIYQTQLGRTASQSQRPPTPPRSPRLSHTKTAPARQNALPIAQPQVSQYRQSMPIEAYRGIVGTPQPTSSRTSSISGSIKAPMKYRGHELTRTGSLSMFQAPQPGIVMNPLSNFSRPRNKYSPPSSFNRPDGGEDSFQAQGMRNNTASSAVSSIHSRSQTPVVRSDSPVSTRSFGSRASRQFTIVTEDSLPKEINNKKTTELPLKVLPVKPKTESPKHIREMKKTASFNFDKAVETTDEKETKRKRRHTFSWKRMSGMDLKGDFKNRLQTPDEEPKASEKSQQSRPKSAEHSSIQDSIALTTEEEAGSAIVDKGKGKEVPHHHSPLVTDVKCCDKCGRIKKLQNGRALVSDGKTTEALIMAGSSSYKLIRSNDDVSGSRLANPAGAANAAQLIMHRQRKPRPEPPAALPVEHSVKDFAATPSMRAPELAKPMQRESTAVTAERPAQTIRSSSLAEPPARITRFASLHGKSKEEEIADRVPMKLNTSFDANTAEEMPQMRATSTPIDEPLPEFMFDPTEDEDEYELAPTQQSRRYSFESQRSVLNVAIPEKPIEGQMSAPEVLPRPVEPLDLSNPITLPEPNLGLHFARSNLTLRGLVLPKGRSSSNLLAEAINAPGNTDTNGDDVRKGLEQSDQIDQVRLKQQSVVSEIMAV